MNSLTRFSVAALALLLSMGGSALAQSGENSRYRQFRDTAAASISNPSTGNVRLFFDSTGFYWKNSAGVATAVGGGGLSALTTGTVPVATSSSAIGNSVITTVAASGSTNRGVVTIYDPDGTDGETRLAIREGADLSGFENLFEIQNNAGTSQWHIGGANNSFTTYMPPSGLTDTGERYFRINSGGYAAPSDGRFGFHSDANTYAGIDSALVRVSAGVLGSVDGSGGIKSFVFSKPVAAKTATYTVLALDSGYTFTTEGTAAVLTFDLPAAAAGLTYTFYCHASTYDITIDAAAGDTIRGATVSGAGGTAMITDEGAWITVTAINATEWIIFSSNGAVVIT